MRIELIMTGEELLDGRVLNANEATITGLLCEEGWQVSRSVTVGDDPLELETAITEACSRSEIVIMTGGLGPTDDDRTSSVIACCLETPLVLNQRVLDGLMARYKKRGMVMPESNRKQAMIPDSATLISNPNGTAPGYRCSFKKALLFALPGVPSEMKVMLLDDVIPTLKKEFSIDLPACGSIRLTCFGCGESEIADRLTPLYPLAEGVEIGYQVTFPEIRIIIKYRDPVVLKDSFVSKMKQCLGDVLISDSGVSLPEVVFNICRDNHIRLAIAESCTGGLISSLMTQFSGASDVLHSSVISYSNASKVSLLGVSEVSLERDGAVSEAVAKEMAQGVRALGDADIGLSVTGISGPTGGTDEKPVGLTVVGYSDKHRTYAKTFQLGKKRLRNQRLAAYWLLSLLLTELQST